MPDTRYRLTREGRETESYLLVGAHGCVVLECADDFYSSELSREDSLALARQIGRDAGDLQGAY